MGRPLPASPQTILVVRQHNQLGDMLCATPLLRQLRLAYPSAFMTLVTSPENHAIMKHHRTVDRVVEFRKMQGLGEFLRLIRSPRPDVAIIPATVSTSATSDLIGLLSGAPRRFGCRSLEGQSSPSAFCLTDPVDLDWRADPGRHQVLRNLEVAGDLVDPGTDLSLDITLTQDEVQAGNAFLANTFGTSVPVISLHPGAGKIPNRWPARLFAETAEVLAAEFGAGILMTCGPMDDEPVARMGEALSIPYTVLRDKGIREVAAILASVSLVVSNDTGIMHVSAGVGTPVLSLFGPTDYRQWSPPGEVHRALHAPGGDMAEITVAQVVQTARGMLRSTGRTRRVLA